MFEISFGVEIIALIAGLILFKKIKPVIYRLMVPFLFITVVNEGFSHYGIYKKIYFNKVIVYNIFFLVQLVVIGLIYLKGMKNDKKLRLIALFFIMIIIIAFGIFINKPAVLNPDYISLICCALILFGFYYIYRLYISGELTNLKSDSLFWLSSGMILAQFLLLLFINALRIDSFRNDINSMKVFKTLNTIGNIFYYLCISYSFICTSIYHRRVTI